ncbi:MAG: PQQ-binding-like beta-propeller repeat protein [Planctomycetota bacterium]
MLVGSDGRLVTRTRNGTVVAIGSNHRQIFQVSVGPGSSAPALLPDDTVVVGADDGRLSAIDAGGSLRWQAVLGAAIGTPSASPDGTIFVATADGHLHRVREDGTIEASTPLSGLELSAPALTQQGDVIVATRSGDLVAIDAAGQIRFRTPVGGRVPGLVAVAADGKLLALTEHDVLVALDAAGRLAWFVDPGAGGTPSGLGGPALAADGTIWFADAAPRLHAVTAEGGVTLSVDLAAALAGAPAIDALGRVYTAGVDGSLQAFDADGAALFTVPAPAAANDPKASGPALGKSGEVVVGTASGNVEVFVDRDPWPALGGGSPRAGSTSIAGPAAPFTSWQIDAASDATASPVIGADGRVHVRSIAGELIALTASGQEIWRRDVGAGSSAPLLARDGSVVCSTDQGRLAAVNRSGKVAWFLELGQRLTTPLEDADGKLVVAGESTIHVVSGTGELLASVAAADGLAQGSPALSASGVLAVATRHATVLLYDVDSLLTPQPRLEVALMPGPVSRCTPAFDRREHLYVLTDRDQLAAFTRDGKPLFTFEPGFATDLGGTGGPIIASGGHVLFGAQDGRLFAVTPGGQGFSFYQAAAPVAARPVVDAADTVYVTAAGAFYGVTVAGSEAFPPLILDPSSQARLGAPAISLAGRIVVGSAAGTIFQLRD